MTTKANAAGLSAARLETLDRFIQTRYIDTGKIPGALTVIARRGEVAHSSALGLADVERKTPMREDTIFVPFHWGGKQSVNRLTNPALDPISRMPEFKVCAVRIEPVLAQAKG